MYHKRQIVSNILCFVFLVPLFLYFYPHIRALAFRQQGLQQALEGKWGEAFFSLKEAYPQRKRDYFLIFTLAQACVKTHRHCGLKYAWQAYKLKEKEESILLVLSSLPQSKEKKRERNRLLRQGVRNFPHSLSLLLALGWEELRENHFRAAEKVFLKASKLDPEHPEPYFGLGTLYEKQERWVQAKRRYREALLRNPLHIQAFEGLKRVSS